VLLKLLRESLQPFRRELTFVVVFQFCATIAALFLPALNADIIDKGVATGDTTYILRVGGMMLAVTVLQVACTITAVYFGARAAMGLGRDVRARIFGRVNEFSTQEVQHFGAPSLITRTTNDVQQVQMLVLLSCTLMVSAPIMAVGGVVMALRQDVGLSWLILVAVLALVLVVSVVITRMVPQFRLMQGRVDVVNRVLREQIAGIRVVRAFVREPVERERFGVANEELAVTALRTGRLMALMFPSVLLILNVSSIGVLWFGGHRVGAGQMEIGALSAFLAYLAQILIAIMSATFMLILIPRASVCADRISEVLDTQPSVVPHRNPTKAFLDSARVEFRGVTFNYPGAEQPVLSDVSFATEPGTTFAIIGSTGAGKTTLLNLVPRLFDVTSGQVCVGGVDVRELDPDVLYDRLGVVPQRAYLFTGTIASNLRYGSATATDEQLWDALRIAQADEFVRALPAGLAAEVAQGGTNFSGGQRQRLAIARAIVRRPDIYLFDDSFSALDLATDARLRLALRPVTRQATVIVVAQRVSTVTDADQILVLEDGRVVGLGRHQDLLTTCPTYGEIVRSQLPAEVTA
jgi:ATP-binding cassette, subfamily B, multidrug efflux pump